MTTPKTPQDRKPKASEIVDAEQEQKELREALLSDMPALRPAYRFRLAHRNDFQNLSLEALKSGAFEGDGALEFDQSKPGDIERLQKLNAFVVSIDQWAETIAEDPAAYAVWAEGKTQEHFMALFVQYRDALGESNSSES